jgi:hypothetical protein
MCSPGGGRRYGGAVDTKRAADLYAHGRTLRQIDAGAGVPRHSGGLSMMTRNNCSFSTPIAFLWRMGQRTAHPLAGTRGADACSVGGRIATPSEPGDEPDRRISYQSKCGNSFSMRSTTASPFARYSVTSA